MMLNIPQDDGASSLESKVSSEREVLRTKNKNRCNILCWW